MLSGKEKAQLLLSILGDNAKSVLNELSPKSAQLLTASIGETPDVDEELKKELIQEVVYQLDEADQPKGFELRLANSAVESEAAPVAKPVQEFRDKNGRLLRSPSEMATTLVEQKPQIQAFFMSKIDEDLKDAIMLHLPLNVQSDLKSMQVETIPISSTIFDVLYKQICEPSVETADT